MAWGARTGVDDLLQRLQQPVTGKNLCVLSFRKLSESDVQKLADAIATNTILDELYLSGHNLGENGVRAFAEVLAVNTTLRHLAIGHDALGDASVELLSEGLARNSQSSLATWDLEYKSIGAKGASAIGKLLQTNKTLTNLNLSRNAIGNEGIKGLLDGLQKNTAYGLTTLTLMEASISGEALDAFAELLTQPHCTFTSLQLSFNSLDSASNKFFAALGSNTSLTQLHLKETNLSDAHVAALAEALKSNTSLKEIDLSDNKLSPTAAAALAEALAVNKTLHRLSLAGTNCGDAGAEALGNVLRDSNTTLVYLDLAQNELTHVGIGSLLRATNLQSLRVFNNKLGDGLQLILPVLTANTTIKSLDLGANALHGELSVTLFNELHGHVSLSLLEMGGNNLGQEGHDALARLREQNTALDIAADKNAQKDGHDEDDE